MQTPEPAVTARATGLLLPSEAPAQAQLLQGFWRITQPTGTLLPRGSSKERQAT